MDANGQRGKSMTAMPLIVSCSADSSHAKEITGKENPIRSQDYLEITVPGAFPSPDLLGTMEQLLLRFSVNRIVIVTHLDCGFVVSLNEFLNDNKTPEFFDEEAVAAVEAIKQAFTGKVDLLGKDIDEIAELLAVGVAYKISEEIIRQAAGHETNANAVASKPMESETKQRELARQKVLDALTIEAYRTTESSSTLTEVLKPTRAKYLFANAKLALSSTRALAQ